MKGLLISHLVARSIFSLAQQPNAGQGRLILKDSRLHSDTPQAIGLLWTRDRPFAETST